jgi:riboflavin biosynthesis pyrimidine reductase
MPYFAGEHADDDEVGECRCDTGGLLAHGGARFARSLVQTGLIDEYRLLIHPVVLSAGERIFLAPLTIEPVRTTVFSGGAVAHVSRRSRDRA